MYYGKVRIKCDIERGHCPANQAIQATAIWEPENHCRILDVGRSYARMIKFQKSYIIETFENNETNSGHTHNAHMYSIRFQKHLYDESALSRFEVLTKPIYKCNEDRPYYATQYQDIFIQYKKDLISSQEHHHRILMTHTLQFQMDHPLQHPTQKQIIATDM